MATHVYAHGQELLAFAYEAVTVADTAIGFTGSTINGSGTGGPAQRATVTVETAQIRYTIDGTTPTSTVGHILNAGDVLVLEGRSNISAARFIRTGGTSGTIRCSFERLFVAVA